VQVQLASQEGAPVDQELAEQEEFLLVVGLLELQPHHLPPESCQRLEPPRGDLVQAVALANLEFARLPIQVVGHLVVRLANSLAEACLVARREVLGSQEAVRLVDSQAAVDRSLAEGLASVGNQVVAKGHSRAAMAVVDDLAEDFGPCCADGHLDGLYFRCDCGRGRPCLRLGDCLCHHHPFSRPCHHHVGRRAFLDLLCQCPCHDFVSQLLVEEAGLALLLVELVLLVAHLLPQVHALLVGGPPA